MIQIRPPARAVEELKAAHRQPQAELDVPFASLRHRASPGRAMTTRLRSSRGNEALIIFLRTLSPKPAEFIESFLTSAAAAFRSRIAGRTVPLQHEFARRAAAIQKLKTAHRRSLVELDTLFASLQHRAFRGEL
jgi:hypothetical protein